MYVRDTLIRKANKTEIETAPDEIIIIFSRFKAHLTENVMLNFFYVIFFPFFFIVVKLFINKEKHWKQTVCAYLIQIERKKYMCDCVYYGRDSIFNFIIIYSLTASKKRPFLRHTRTKKKAKTTNIHKNIAYKAKVGIFENNNEWIKREEN